jgi:hypothetical protein
MRKTLAALLGCVLSAAGAAAQQPERETLSGERVAIFDVAGQVTVEAGTGAQVVVEIRRGGRDAARLTLARGPVPEMPGFETLRVVFPREDIVYPPLGRGSRTQMTLRENGTFGGGRDRRGRRQSITISGSGDGIEAWADLRILVPAGRRLDINLGVGQVSLANVNGQISVDASAAPVTARDLQGSFDVDVGSGTVSITNAQGDLSVDTGSGDVEVTTSRGARFLVDTGSGTVSGTGIAADVVNVDTGSGNIVLSGVTSGDITLDTGSGDVELALTSDVSSLRVDTGSGSVVLRVPETLGAAVDIETGSGGIETDLPLEVTRWGNDRVTGRIGDGNGRIDVETGSGRILIHRI